MTEPARSLDNMNMSELVQELQSLRQRVEEQEREIAFLRARRGEMPWDEVRERFMERIGKLPISGYEASQLLAALSTIVRHRFNLSMVRYLSKGDAEEAAQIADFIATTLERRWNNRQEVES
jgi:hypothetical protein